MTWIDEMIERQALPEVLREGKVSEFCKKHSIAESTYYLHASKPENQKRIIGLALNNAKKHAPEVLENLGVRGKKDNRAAELYMKFILELAEKSDISSMGNPIMFMPSELMKKNDLPQNSESGSTKQ